MASKAELREMHAAATALRGDTATNVTKGVTLETGAVIQVPAFVNQGDMVRVDTRTGQYIERVKWRPGEAESLANVFAAPCAAA